MSDHDLLIRIDERLKSLDGKMDTHIVASEKRNADFKEEMKEVKRDIKAINKWRYGVIGSWVVAIGSYLRGGV